MEMPCHFDPEPGHECDWFTIINWSLHPWEAWLMSFLVISTVVCMFIGRSAGVSYLHDERQNGWKIPLITELSNYLESLYCHADGLIYTPVCLYVRVVFKLKLGRG